MRQNWQERHAELDCVSVSDFYNFVILFFWPLSAGARNHSPLRNTYICNPDARQRRIKNKSQILYFLDFF